MRLNGSNKTKTYRWDRVLIAVVADKAELNLARGRPHELPGPKEQI